MGTAVFIAPLLVPFVALPYHKRHANMATHHRLCTASGAIGYSGIIGGAETAAALDQPLRAATDLSYPTDYSSMPGTPRRFTGTLLYGLTTKIGKKNATRTTMPAVL